MEDIIVLEKDLYLVHGKVIRANTPGMFEGDSGRAELLEIADNFLYKPLSCTYVGDPAVFGFHRLENDPDGATRMFSTREPLDELPDTVKAIIRKEAPELERWI